MSAATRAPAPAPAPLAYSVTGAAAAIQVSERTIGHLIENSVLVARYVGTKRVILASELHAYLESLPYSRP